MITSLTVRYFVITDDGSRFGPADLSTLNQWAREGRLLGHQMVEEETGGRRLRADQVPGLNFAPAEGGYAPPAGAAYPRQTFGDPSKDLQTAWICGVLGLFCCGFVFGYFGLQACKRAEEKGGNATGPRVLNIVAIVFAVIAVIVRLAMFSLRS